MGKNFLNWPKVLWTIRYLNDLNEKTYFNLDAFCQSYGLDYIKIKNFLDISNGIIDGNSELIRAIENEKETLEKLNNLDPQALIGL